MLSNASNGLSIGISPLSDAQQKQLKAVLPKGSVKPHPTKKNLSVIHPMAVVDRLNEVFGLGGWHFHVVPIDCVKEVQKTSKGERDVYSSSVHGIFTVPKYDIHLEQFGGSTNDDRGDSLKGGATDALTKIASYLGIGASIYKGLGNVAEGEPADLTIDEFEL